MVHKTSWTVHEIEERLETADSKTRWTNTQVETLISRINELNDTIDRLNKEQLFLTTLLDFDKTNNEIVRVAADAMGLKLPTKSRKK